MTDRVKDLELDEFVQLIVDNDDELAKKASTYELDISAIVGKAKPSIDKYLVSTGIAYAQARIKEAILEASSEVMKGMIVGCRDRFGTNAPIRIPILSSKGDHHEVVNWGTNVKYGDTKIDIPFPSIATFKVVYDGEFKGVPNIKVVSLDAYENLSVPDAILRLNKIAKCAGEVDGGDELQVIAVKGKIAYVSPATKWKGKEKDGSWAVWVQNQRDNPVSHPVIQLSLETENNNSVRAVFDRQRNAIPTVLLEDFTDICIDASKKFTDPIEQARFVGEVFRGKEVIIVGFVTKYNSTQQANYIDIGACAIFDATVSSSAPSKSKVSDAEEDEPKPAKKPSAKKKEEPVDEDEEDTEPKKKPAPADKKKESKPGELTVEKLKDKIRQYCSAVDLSFSDITAELVMKNLAPGKTRAFVEDVLEELRSENQ